MHDKAGVGFQIGRALIAACFLAFFTVVSLAASWQTSPTFDEPLHLYAGYSYLTWSDFRVNPEHPALVKALAALPFIGAQLKSADITRAQRDRVERDKDYSWQLAGQFIFANRENQRLFFYPKVIMIGLAAILGIVVFLWARDIYGWPAGVAALAIYCLDPNTVAHSSLIHTDLPFTLFFAAGTYLLWHMFTRPTVAGLLATSLCFALSSVTKFSFLAILPIWGVLGLVHGCSSQPRQAARCCFRWLPQPSRRWVWVAIVTVSAALAAYIMIWTVYGFRFDAVAQEHMGTAGHSLMRPEKDFGGLRIVNSRYSIVPDAWLYGLVDALESFHRGSYLLGQISDHGSWFYFPVAVAVKTPLPTLVLLVVGLLSFLFSRRLRRAELFLVIPVIIFFSAAVAGRLNIGVRHILPIYPFLFVWLGGVAFSIWRTRGQLGRWGVMLLGSWLVFSSLSVHPNYIAFFNELARGPANGHRFLVDSNLDWGQDLKGLKAWMDENKVSRIRLAYFGTMDPAFYGIDAVPAPGSLSFLWRAGQENTPVSPYIAISATHLAGLYLAEPGTYASFRNKTPVASIGHSIMVFRDDP
jgi:hypothetical protein